jgi:hypothetical protein
MSNSSYQAESAVPLSLTIRHGRWMISNMRTCIPRRIRLYHLIPGGPGCAEVTWKCVFPKPPVLPPPAPCVKPSKSKP